MNVGIVASSKAVSNLDSDTQAYITAAGITDPVLKDAANTFVLQTKAAGLWSYLYAFYPYLGGNATSHKYNIKGSNFTLTFNGGYTHNSDGVKANGSTGYANTGFTPSIHSTEGVLMGIGLFNKLGENTDNVGIDMGATSNTNRRTQIYTRFGNTFYGQINTDNSISDNMASSDSSGLSMAVRTAVNVSFLQKDTTQSDETTNSLIVTQPIFIGAGNDGTGTPTGFSSRTQQCAFITKTMTKAQGLQFQTIVSNFIANRAGAPIVNAGSDQAISQPANSVSLNGSATDNGTISSYLWTKDSGPTCTITSPSSASTTITGMATVGEYVFRLTATDNTALTGFDTVKITVNAVAGSQFQTTFGSPSWNAYVHLPDDYVANPSTYYPTIIFFPGLGEVGSDASKLLVSGPNAYIASGGWDGNALVGATLHKFIVISLQPPSAYPSEGPINTRLSLIKAAYRVDPTRLYLTGLSHGGWCAACFVTGDPLGGPFTYASQIAAVVDVQGVTTNGDNNPYPQLYDNFADVGGRFLAFEQTLDNRDLQTPVNRMNARVADSAIWVSTNYDGGGHGSFDRYYGKSTAPTNYVLDGVNQNIYQWMAQQ